MTADSNKEDGSQSLNDRLLKWLRGEGYPLEFRTAHAFHDAGFIVDQGVHVRQNGAAPREIDVRAHFDTQHKMGLVRVSYVVECKWTRDHPWVVFTSEETPIAPSACIAQMQGTDVARAALWCLAGSKILTSLDMFSAPSRGGFNGRQAFTKGKDQFYDSVQAAVTNSTTVAAQANHPERGVNFELEYAEAVRPLIVIDGPLFEAFFDPAIGDVVLHQKDHLRVYWRGSEAWPMFVAVDVVRVETLAPFLAKLLQETIVLLRALDSTVSSFCDALHKKNMALVGTTPGPRGFRGQPSFIKRLSESITKAEGGNKDS